MPNWVAAKNENGNFRSDFNGPIMHNFGQKLDALLLKVWLEYSMLHV